MTAETRRPSQLPCTSYGTAAQVATPSCSRHEIADQHPRSCFHAPKAELRAPTGQTFLLKAALINTARGTRPSGKENRQTSIHSRLRRSSPQREGRYLLQIAPQKSWAERMRDTTASRPPAATTESRPVDRERLAAAGHLPYTSCCGLRHSHQRRSSCTRFCTHRAIECCPVPAQLQARARHRGKAAPGCRPRPDPNPSIDRDRSGT